MALPDELHLRVADQADLPSIAAMREAVGWGVHPWALQWVLEPAHARCLVVDDRDRIVGVGSGIAYGRLGFVGNMIVDTGYRRRGIGSAILESVVDFLTANGAARLELYATENGRPLYARHGFEPTGPSTMVRVPRGIESPQAVVELSDADGQTADELVAYDAPRFGGDRGMLLRRMIDDPDRPLVVGRHDGEIVGHGWVRPDGERVGPLVAESPEIAIALIREALDRMPDAEALTLNLPAGNRIGAARLAELGATLEPWDGRMALGPEVPRREDTIYSNVVGALG
jgi:GNAT superfamily N-acetyltransferase